MPTLRVKMMKREHKSPEHVARNSLGQVPVLELDDGTFLCESIAICRYFEALHPAPPLFGTGAKQQALVEMWVRRVHGSDVVEELLRRLPVPRTNSGKG